MKYTLDMWQDDLSTFRLMADGTFRTVEYGHTGLLDQDRAFPTAEAAYEALDQLKPPLILDGKETGAHFEDGEWTIGEPIHFHVTVHREGEATAAPTVEAVRDAIRSGRQDQLPACLVAHTDGSVSLLPFFSDAVARPTFACRAPVLGDCDIGLEAAQDYRHVFHCLHTLLASWKTHLATGELDVFSDGN